MKKSGIKKNGLLKSYNSILVIKKKISLKFTLISKLQALIVLSAYTSYFNKMITATYCS